MAARDTPSPRRPSRTAKDREFELINLAEDLAERQLREGTASAQVISHYLKLGSSREALEQERLRLESELVQAKREVLEAQRGVEGLYEAAINAMRRYSGETTDAEDVDYGD